MMEKGRVKNSSELTQARHVSIASTRGAVTSIDKKPNHREMLLYLRNVKKICQGVPKNVSLAPFQFLPALKISPSQRDNAIRHKGEEETTPKTSPRTASLQLHMMENGLGEKIKRARMGPSWLGYLYPRRIKFHSQVKKCPKLSNKRPQGPQKRPPWRRFNSPLNA